MDGREGATRPFAGLVPYEWLFAALGCGAVGALVFLASREQLPATGPLAVLCVLSALSVHFNVDADDGGKISASAQGMVAAAAIFAFRQSSPMLGPMLVAMAAAFWRVPRSRHQWFTIPGNFAVYGFPALAAGALLAQTSPTTLSRVLAVRDRPPARLHPQRGQRGPGCVLRRSGREHSGFERSEGALAPRTGNVRAIPFRRGGRSALARLRPGRLRPRICDVCHGAGGLHLVPRARRE